MFDSYFTTYDKMIKKYTESAATIDLKSNKKATLINLHFWAFVSDLSIKSTVISFQLSYLNKFVCKCSHKLEKKNLKSHNAIKVAI